ncbi:13454_t:CDS:2 [Entrophospora sp. SA101]|nr:8208_t:CDS:2 [Entrophospora sp. SA101]CAJ0759278.1 13454_t:CDS:2 [Entrophospora sp. SA101]CAJ0841119.1 6940_t:CDS:2 [Entrophospora sp. SA101]
MDGQKYMNEEDFLTAIAPGEDYKEIKKEIFSALFKVADTNNKGLISLQDFVIFENLLLKPNAEYEIAFRLFDIKGKGKITIGQFKQILQSYLKKSDSIPFNFDCDWLKLYASNDKHELTYEEFSQLLKGLEGEKIRQEFMHYDKEGNGYIKPDQFKQIMLSTAKHKLSDFVIDHLDTIADLSKNGRINYAVVVAFHNVLRQMNMVERIVLKSISNSKDGKITKNDFINTASKETLFSLFTPLEIDIVFHFARLLENKPDDRLSRNDFIQLLDNQWHQKSSETKRRVAIIDVYSLTLGSIAGSVGATSVYPIDLVKTRMQNQRTKVVGEVLYKNSIDCFRKVLKSEGIAGLYSGLGPQLIGVAPEKAIKLTANDFVRSLLTDKKTGEISFKREILSGGVAGGCQVFTNPLEIVKIRLQVQGQAAKSYIKPTPHKSALSIVKTLGITGLYKGTCACLLRDIPFSAIYFPAYSHIKKDFFQDGKDGKKCGLGELLLSGAIAGMPAAYFTTPADVIKTRLQAEARQGQTQYNGIIDATKKICREEGFKALFRGGPARVLRSSPQFGTTLMVYELLYRWLPWNEPNKVATTNINDDYNSMGYLKSRNALKILLDLDYKFGATQK